MPSKTISIVDTFSIRALVAASHEATCGNDTPTKLIGNRSTLVRIIKRMNPDLDDGDLNFISSKFQGADMEVDSNLSDGVLLFTNPSRKLGHDVLLTLED